MTTQHYQTQRPSSGPRPLAQPAAHTTPTVHGKPPVLSSAERTARTQARKRNNVVHLPRASAEDNYKCPELQQNPGIPAARFTAYQLPSRVGNWLYYPDGSKQPFPGSAADPARSQLSNK